MAARKLFLLFLMGVWVSPPALCPFAAAQMSLSPETAAPAQIELKEDLRKDRIAPGDVISIVMFPGEEYSREVTVQPDGTIQMPLIGTILVKGLTIRQLQELLQKKYSRYVANPQVTANVQRFSGRRIAVIGEIRSPGFYDYRDGMRMLELISLAGGLGSDARGTRIRVLRQKGFQDHSFSVNFQAVLDGDTSRDPLLAPGDTVFVPQQPFTEGSAWVNRNILPWALVLSMLATVIVATRK